MNIKKYFYLIAILLAITLFIPSKGRTQPKSGTKAPVITHSFAVEKGI
jgi:hypothetical protein